MSLGRKEGRGQHGPDFAEAECGQERAGPSGVSQGSGVPGLPRLSAERTRTKEIQGNR